MTETTWHTLPIIDWELGKKLAGNNLDLAQDMLALLTEKLPSDITKLVQLFTEQNYSALRHHVHTLYGAVAYCGTPRLKAILAHLDAQLNLPTTHGLSDLLNQLDIEVRNLLREYQKK